MLPLAFVLLLLLSFSVLHLMLRPPSADRAVKARLIALYTVKKNKSKDDDGLVREETQGISHLIGESLKHYDFAEDLEHLIIHAGSSASVGSIALTSIGLAIASGLVGACSAQNTPSRRARDAAWRIAAIHPSSSSESKSAEEVRRRASGRHRTYGPRSPGWSLYGFLHRSHRRAIA